MAQARRPPEEKRTEEGATFLEQMRALSERIRTVRLTPEQRESVMRIIETMTQAMQQASSAAAAARPVPARRPGAVPRTVVAPARRYVYDITLEGRRYTLELERQLTPGHEAQELLRMARNGDFFEQLPRRPGESDDAYARRATQTPNWPRPCIAARRVATSTSRDARAEADAFNRQTETVRADGMMYELNRAAERAIPERRGDSLEQTARRRDANYAQVPLTVTFREERAPPRGG